MSKINIAPSITCIILGSIIGGIITGVYYNKYEKDIMPTEVVTADKIELSGKNKAKNEEVFPDTSSWPNLLNRTLSISYSSGNRICVNLSQSYRDKKDGIEPEVFVTKPPRERRSSFKDYRYTVLLDNASVKNKQLAELQKAGFLEAETSEHDGKQSIVYKLTTKGWGELPNDSYGSSLCYISGTWKINKILDYTRLDDQSSGLEAYKVKYESNLVYEKWATKKVLNLFESKKFTAKQGEAVLVKGSTGYFNPNTARNRGLYQNTMMPTKDTAVEILLRSKEFLSNLCYMDKVVDASIEERVNTKQCAVKPKANGYPFEFYYIGIPKGNMLTFKFSFINAENKIRHGKGYFKKNNKNDWVIDSSFSLLSN